MKKNLFIFFCFVIPIIFLGNIGEAKAETSCNYKVKAFQSITSPYYAMSDNYHYNISINTYGDNKYLTFTNAYFDGSDSSSNDDLLIKQGQTKTYRFEEILDSELNVTISGADGEQYELDFKSIVRNFSSCDTIVYERLKTAEGYVRFRYKDEQNGDVCNQFSPDSYYGTITCVDSNNESDDIENVCIPTIGDNSFDVIKYYFPDNSNYDGGGNKRTEITIEFPSGIIQTLPLYKNDEDNSFFTFIDAKDCIECFEEFHTTASGKEIFSEYVTLYIDEELAKQIYTDKSNYSCPAKIYGILTFVEWGEKGKPEILDTLEQEWMSGIDKPVTWAAIKLLKGWQGTMGSALLKYVSDNANYDYSNYNYANIFLTTKNCENECYSVTTSDTLVIIDEQKNNLDLGEIEDCQYLKADEFYGWLRGLLKVVRIGAIILVVILTGLDALKSFVSFDEKNSKNFYKHLLNRLMCIAILFLAPSVIELFISLFNANDVISKVSAEPFCGLLKK